MSIIFLDNDGVICLSRNFGTRETKMRKWIKKHDNHNFPLEIKFDNFDKGAIKILNEICRLTESKLVISSDWKLHATLEELQTLFADRGITAEIVGVTPNLKDFDLYTSQLFAWKSWLERARIVEIREYLKNNPGITKWIAIDDMNLGAEGLENFVHTSRVSEGIKQTGIKEKILNLL